jgi:hypothetical protein
MIKFSTPNGLPQLVVRINSQEICSGRTPWLAPVSDTAKFSRSEVMMMGPEYVQPSRLSVLILRIP